MHEEGQDEELTPKEKNFCSEFIFDWNATRAYKSAYPNTSNDNVAAVSANKMLRKPKIQAYIKEIQQDLEKQAGISRLKVLRELEKIAFSSTAHLHVNWLERKEFDQLTDAQKDCISEINTKILKKNIGTTEKPEIIDVEYVKIKLYDKQKALDAISKMLGYNEPEKIEHLGDGLVPLVITKASDRHKSM